MGCRVRLVWGRREHWIHWVADVLQPAAGSIVRQREWENSVLLVGDDWAEDHHDVERVDPAEIRLAKARLPEGTDGISRLPAMIGGHVGDDLEPTGADRDRGRSSPVGRNG